jgi:hypothetical protein
MSVRHNTIPHKDTNFKKEKARRLKDRETKEEERVRKVKELKIRDKKLKMSLAKTDTLLSLPYTNGRARELSESMAKTKKILAEMKRKLKPRK